ncbi:hypothetical protein DPQ33_13270 [Oceanidesulfovibrio indonesiensis]|uniref:Transposase DDE domain-containing protein n=1 Tax=Oceanidesulfovibrio indonesiensis TaxID=54767 RepID=A0A7M3MC47_9BACT|nr:hypothetical protein DPQ33_13270 [Oceanidesulfovibrio indonesiensis]
MKTVSLLFRRGAIVQAGARQCICTRSDTCRVFFCKIKEFRRIATRFEKLEKTFLTILTIASCLIWLR